MATIGVACDSHAFLAHIFAACPPAAMYNRRFYLGKYQMLSLWTTRGQHLGKMKWLHVSLPAFCRLPHEKMAGIMRCEHYSGLERLVEEHLENLRRLTDQQLRAFRIKDQNAFTRLDKEVEQELGAKERAISALRQHAEEHGYHPVRKELA